MGVIICRWNSGVADGIYWIWDQMDDPDCTLFQVMERYLTRGETMEILSYAPEGGDNRDRLMVNERSAHKEDA